MAKHGIYPAPIYEATLSDGQTYRLSFWSPADKPIDVAAGRKAADEILLNDYAPRPQSLAEAYRNRQKIGGVYMTPTVRVSRIPMRFERVNGLWRCPWPKLPLQITAGHVEHQSIGRIEDTPDNRQAVAKATRQPGPKAIIAAARAALESGDVDAALVLLGGQPRKRKLHIAKPKRQPGTSIASMVVEIVTAGPVSCGEIVKAIMAKTARSDSTAIGNSVRSHLSTMTRAGQITKANGSGGVVYSIPATNAA